MKFKKFILTVISAVFGAIACLSVTACDREKAHPQKLNYTESVANINNPDQGFYRPVYVKVSEEGVSYDQNIVTASTRLYHLRADISAFSGAVNGTGDRLLTQAALDGLGGLLSYLKTKDKNAIVRFAYDPSYGGKKDQEPALEIILQHIQQISPVLNAYRNTITAIETGLIGPWGEMHSSKIANAEHISPIVDTFLSCTSNIPVLVRTPEMIYNYLGITMDEAETCEIPATENSYRLGLYNDGFLGSDSDLGTYTNREKEIKFLNRQTAHLPFGGEVVVPESSLHDIDACLPEMNMLHLSYLNVEWNNRVIDKWKNSAYTEACGKDKIYYGKTAFEYIENHMGYRFVLSDSVFGYSDKPDKLSVKLTLKNVGFGNLNKEKKVKFIFTDENREVKSTEYADVRFTGNTAFQCSLKLNLSEGKYDVYLCLYGEVNEGEPLYCLQFANDGLWNSALKANKIGSIEIK